MKDYYNGTIKRLVFHSKLDYVESLVIKKNALIHRNFFQVYVDSVTGDPLLTNEEAKDEVHYYGSVDYVDLSSLTPIDSDIAKLLVKRIKKSLKKKSS